MARLVTGLTGGWLAGHMLQVMLLLLLTDSAPS